MKIFSTLLIIIIIVAVSIVGGTFYTLNETQQAVITQFGKPVGAPVTKPGLHWKLPFIQDVNYFEKRFLAWDGEPNQITTKDKRFIWVDTYARWRIADPLLFFQRLRDERRAQSRLDDILDGGTRNVVAKHRLIELVRSSNADTNGTAGNVSDELAAQKIRYGREELAREVLESAKPKVADLGIDILDFRFKRINYVEQVRKEVYARMISERKRIAEQYRSEGAGEAARIEGEKERELKVITSEAYKKAKEIKGSADAKASEIYAKAYNEDPDFYRFLRTLETYRKALGENSTILISTGSDLFKYFDRVNAK